MVQQYTRVAHVDPTVQTERAYQAQSAVNENIKGRKNINKAGRVRYWKNVGLGFKTPKAAIAGRYVDKKCPFTGNVSIRGRILKGEVVSAKMKRTIVIRRNYLHYIKKYNRFEKRHRNISVHCSPAFPVKEGDIVTIGQCRPLSKTVRFNVVAHEPSAGKKPINIKKCFRVF